MFINNILNRYFILSGILVFTLLGLLFRLINLHVFQQDFLRDQGNSRSHRVVDVPTYRGMILDRNNEVLAISMPIKTVWLNPKEFDIQHGRVQDFINILQIEKNKFYEQLNN